MDNDTNTTTNDERSDAVVSPQGETPTTSVTGETPETTKAPTSPDELQEQITRLQAALKKANAESAGHRHKAKELDDLKARLEAEQLSEKERLEKQLASLQKTHDEYLLRSQERINAAELRAQAAHLGFADLDDAARLIDYAELEHDDDGVPTNARAVLERLLKAKPYLKMAGKPAPTSGGATNPSRSATNGAQPITEAFIAGLTPDQYNGLSPARKAEVTEWLRTPKHLRH